MERLRALFSQARDRGYLYAAFVPLETEQQSPLFTGIFQSGNLADLLNKLFFAAISIGAILAVIKIMWAGYLYMASELWTKKQTAKDTLANAIIGLLILLAIRLILYQINPQLLNLDILTGVTKIQ